MNFVSFNIRGLGSGPKRAAFKHFLDVVKPCVVFLQETMAKSVDACNFFLHIKSDWQVCALDARGHLGGTLVAWNPLVASLKAYHHFAGI